MQTINEQYEKLLEMGDKIGEEMVKEDESKPLTDEQIKDIATTLSSADVSPDTKLYNDIRSEERSNEDGYAAIETPVINPNNGMVVTAGDVGAATNITIDQDIDIDQIMNLDGIDDFDVSTVDITEESLTKAVAGIYPGIKINKEDISALINLAKRVAKGEEFRYYQAMPQNIKNSINLVLGDMAPTMGSYHKEGRNFVAKELLDSIVEQSVTDTANKDLNTAMLNTLSDLNQSSQEVMADYFKLQKEQYEVNYPAQADVFEKAIENGEIKEEDIESIQAKIKIYRGVAHSFVQSYMLTEMMDAYRNGKCKVKNIQISKIKRTCEDFNCMYMRSTNAINDLRLVIPVLDRHLSEDIHIDTIKKFVCIFVNYTRKMSPANIVEHTFMYYFIKHILSLDHYNKSNSNEEEFYSALINRLNGYLLEIQG